MSAYGMNSAGLGELNLAVPDADDVTDPSVPVHTQLMAVTTLGRPTEVGLTINCGNDHINFIGYLTGKQYLKFRQ